MKWPLVLLIAVVLAFWLGGLVNRTPKPIAFPNGGQQQVVSYVTQWIEEHDGAYLVSYEQDGQATMVKVVIVTDTVEMWYFVFERDVLEHMFCSGC